MKKIYDYKMFLYEPKKEYQYLKALKSKRVVIEIRNKKRKIKGTIENIFAGALSNELQIKQKKQDVYIPIYLIDRIWEIR